MLGLWADRQRLDQYWSGPQLSELMVRLEDPVSLSHSCQYSPVPQSTVYLSFYSPPTLVLCPSAARVCGITSGNEDPLRPNLTHLPKTCSHHALCRTPVLPRASQGFPGPIPVLGRSPRAGNLPSSGKGGWEGSGQLLQIAIRACMGLHDIHKNLCSSLPVILRMIYARLHTLPHTKCNCPRMHPFHST